MNRSPITLLTDFGSQDTYVGQMKGVIAGINPDAAVIDLTHFIPPQQIPVAAMALVDAVPPFPDGTIHIVVVDPGVGSSRRAIAAEMGPYKFVCPDNGLLTLVQRRYGLKRAVVLDRPQFWRTKVSQTFHGRDIFAPVAAAWSRGCDILELGSVYNQPLVELDLPEPATSIDPQDQQICVQGSVLAVDHFGNLITNVERRHTEAIPGLVQVQVSGRSLAGVVNCYSEQPAGSVVALFGSSGRLEVAVVNGSASRQLNAGIGTSVSVFGKALRP